MPQISISIALPYLLRLPDRVYQTGAEGGAINLSEKYASIGDSLSAKHTSVSSTFDAASSLQPEQQVEVQKGNFERLLRRTNRLIRWYRSETRQAAVVELTRSQASPPSFMEVDTGLAWGIPLLVESDPPLLSSHFNSKSIAKSVRNGLVGVADREVVSLFMQDERRPVPDYGPLAVPGAGWLLEQPLQELHQTQQDHSRRRNGTGRRRRGCAPHGPSSR